MTTLSTAERAKLAKVMGMTASDQDGEALNAARQANRILRQANMGWHELLIDPAQGDAPATQQSRSEYGNGGGFRTRGHHWSDRSNGRGHHWRDGPRVSRLRFAEVRPVIRWICEHHAHCLSDWERGFLQSLFHQRARSFMTDKQAAKYTQIRDRVQRAAEAGA